MMNGLFGAILACTARQIFLVTVFTSMHVWRDYFFLLRRKMLLTSTGVVRRVFLAMVKRVIIGEWRRVFLVMVRRSVRWLVSWQVLIVCGGVIFGSSCLTLFDA